MGSHRTSRSVRLLVVGETVSQLGTQMAYIALPWFALEVTGDNAVLASIVIAALVLPLVLIGIPAGAIADRVDLRRMLIACNIGQAASMAAIPALHYAGLLTYPLLVLLSFTAGVFLAPYHSSLMALVPRVVVPEGDNLARANASFQIGLQLARIAGPILGGVIIAFAGATIAILVKAASFLFAAVAVAAVEVLPGPPPRPAKHLFADVAEALRHIRANPILMLSIVFAVTMSFLFTPTLDVVLPVFAKEDLQSPLLLGLMVSGFGLGALGGALSYPRLAKHLFRGWKILIPLLGASLPFVLVPLTGRFPYIGIAACGIIGFFYAAVQILFMTRVQEWTPDGMRARVFSTFFALILLATPLGLIAAGPAVDILGSTTVFYAVAAGLGVGAVFFVSFPLVRSELFRGREAQIVNADGSLVAAPDATGGGIPGTSPSTSSAPPRTP